MSLAIALLFVFSFELRLLCKIPLVSCTGARQCTESANSIVQFTIVQPIVQHYCTHICIVLINYYYLVTPLKCGFLFSNQGKMKIWLVPDPKPPLLNSKTCLYVGTDQSLASRPFAFVYVLSPDRDEWVTTNSGERSSPCLLRVLSPSCTT